MIDKKLLINFSSIIYYLIPISLLTGPLIPEIILLLINLTLFFPCVPMPTTTTFISILTLLALQFF